MIRRSGAFLLSLVATFLMGLPVAAQEEVEIFDLFRSRLTLGGESSGERSFREDEGPYIDASEDTLLMRSANVSLNVPLGGTHVRPEGSLLGYQFFAHAAGGASSVDLDAAFLDDDLGLYRSGLGLSALILSRSRKLYAAALIINGAEEEESRDDPDLRYTGVGLGSFHRGSTLWIYGGAFTYQLGRGLALPVFGGWSRISPNWSLAGVVPFFFRAAYQPAPAWSLGLFAKVNGNRYGFDNSDDPDTPANDKRLPGEPQDLFLRLVQGKLGADLSWRVSDHFSLVAEAGSLVGRRLIFSDSDEEIFSAEIEPAGYASLKVGFTFGDTLFDEASP